MLVSEIYPEAKKIFAGCDESELLRKISRASSELANMAQWDWMLGCLSLNVQNPSNNNPAITLNDACGFVVLPSFVEVPLGLNEDGFPTIPRDRWFVHHINGPGKYTAINCYRSFWDDKGEVVIIRSIPAATTVTAANAAAGDAGLHLRLFGLDENGREIYDTDGKPGINVEMNVPTTVRFSSITAVYRQRGAGVITLTNNTTGELLGYYYPNEVTPKYRLVRVPKRCRTVTMTYRKSNVNVTSQEDWIPLWNTNAMIEGMQMVFFRDQRDYEHYKISREIAKELLTDEEQQRNAQSPIPPQVMNTSSNASCRLYPYSYWGYTGGWGGGAGGCC